MEKDSQPLFRDFFNRKTVEVAKGLLGKTLVREIDGEILIARIVEVEGYLGEHDPAAHASFRKTDRTKILYGHPGYAYIFQMHGQNCLNAVAEERGSPGCVLIRGGEPIKGIEKMREFRSKSKKEIKDIEIANGPGKLCQALNIDMSLYGADMTSSDSPLQIHEGDNENFEIETSKRIGITKAADWELRFTIKDNKFVSR